MVRCPRHSIFMILAHRNICRVNLFGIGVGYNLNTYMEPCDLTGIRPVIVAENMIGCAMYELVGLSGRTRTEQMN